MSIVKHLHQVNTWSNVCITNCVILPYNFITMKKSIIILTLLLTGGLYAENAKAQQTALVADQNPRYMESQVKYAAMADTLTALQGTTIQNTYKAYDWYQDKLERRKQNREWRHQEIMNGSYYDYYRPSIGLFGGYSYPFGNYGYSYGNRWGRGGNWGSRASVGIGFGW
jgi:hypothetical protein